ncbi:MAG: SDR family oxidoreductase [Candidatus Aceula meridiana]|nr:SDR family oxidoreductase [Candidatus Aceula meridiana]
MNKHILVTGSRGFIGRRIEGGKPFKGDVSDYTSLYMQTENVTGIVHLAAKGNEIDCQLYLKKTIEANLLGVLNVLEIALERKLWVLFISTYQIRKETFYGLSKLMGEELCRLYEKKGVNVAILRLPIVYGENDKQYKVVTKFINQLKNGIEPTIMDLNMFQFLYVDDAAKIIEREANVLDCKFGNMHSLCDLRDGIKKCLQTEGTKDDR